MTSNFQKLLRPEKFGVIMVQGLAKNQHRILSAGNFYNN